jgi:hypothetical protein
MLPSKAVDPGVVTLTDASLSEIDIPPVSELICGMEVRTDGTLYELSGDTGVSGPDFTPLNPSTDWIIPNSSAALRTWHVRMTKTGGGTLDAGSSTIGSWIALGGGASWYLQEADSPGSPFTWQGTLDISDDGGSTIIDSADFDFTITTRF